MTRTTWTIERMVTEARATNVARSLFPAEVATGDCRNEMGREGEPCRICADRREAWEGRVKEVRKAVIDAFS